MKYVGYLVVLVGIALLGYSYFEMNFKGSGQGSAKQKLVSVEECNVHTKTYVATDHHMAGLIENGMEFDVQMNWYKCHPIEKGDVVLFQYSKTKDPVPRIVRAVPGDSFKLVKAQNHWNIEINGKLLKNGDEPYFFGANVPPTLSLYEKTNPLDQDRILIFSNKPPGGLDSSSSAVVSIQDILGKVELNTIRPASVTPEQKVESPDPSQVNASSPPVAAEQTKARTPSKKSAQKAVPIKTR